jgi:hypothetical protein
LYFDCDVGISPFGFIYLSDAGGCNGFVDVFVGGTTTAGRESEFLVFGISEFGLEYLFGRHIGKGWNLIL